MSNFLLTLDTHFLPNYFIIMKCRWRYDVKFSRYAGYTLSPELKQRIGSHVVRIFLNCVYAARYMRLMLTDFKDENLAENLDIPRDRTTQN